MIRSLHRWPGLIALALITVLSLSGAALSVFPLTEQLSSPQVPQSGLSVATLAERIQTVHPGVEQIRRAPSGRITAFWVDPGSSGSAVIDPATGQGVASAAPSQLKRWLTNLHRSLFLGDGGRVAAALGAASLLILALSGIALVARRTGGMRHWFSRLRGPLAGRLHVEIARVAVAGLTLSSVTALWMTASTFGLLPDGGAMPPPPTTSGQTGASLATMTPLAKTPVSELRALSFPYPNDPTDVFTLKTDRGTALIDQGTGKQLSWTPLTSWQRLYETIYMLHTGEGAAPLGILLGLMALSIPIMGVTGIAIWLAGRRGRPRIRANRPAASAETIVLVGSEGGSTWGFAATLHAALSKAGQSVHTGPMSRFDPDRCRNAARIIVLAATFGDGGPPASARGFLDRFAKLKPLSDVPIAVLGFGDRSFPAFCGFAQEVSQVARAQGWRELLSYDTVDRQSPQDFARWGRALGDAIGLPLELSHHPLAPKSSTLTLVSRRDYGAGVQAPTAILRFALPRQSLWQRLRAKGFARFEAGDLLGIVPDGSTVPRFYSLASNHRDRFIEIVVKHHPGGLCSGQLIGLEPGATVAAFLRRNPAFRPGRGHAPLILIGAGTGIGPLAGIIRANACQRPLHLFFGLRHPDSDFLYGEEMRDWQASGGLSRLVTAVSRDQRPRYVQDALRRDAAEVARLIGGGARVMVCGGRSMAAGVTEVLSEILRPIGLTPAGLKAEGRYVEDVY